MSLYVIDERSLEDLKRAHDALLDTPFFRDDRVETARLLIIEVINFAEVMPDDGIFP